MKRLEKVDIYGPRLRAEGGEESGFGFQKTGSIGPDRIENAVLECID